MQQTSSSEDSIIAPSNEPGVLEDDPAVADDNIDDSDILGKYIQHVTKIQ